MRGRKRDKQMKGAAGLRVRERVIEEEEAERTFCLVALNLALPSRQKS